MWGALVIPAFAILVLIIWFRKHLVWWELLIPFAPAILIPIFIVTTEAAQTYDVEWLTQKTTKVEHYEKYVREWEEWVPEQGHYETDDDGNSHYVVDEPGHYETQTEYHPEHWEKVGQFGHSYGITKNEYERIKNSWGNEIYTDLVHFNQRHYIGDGRGDMFHSVWPGTHEKIEPITWTKSWENRVQASNAPFAIFPKIEPERAKELFELPKPDRNHNTPAILGNGGPTQHTANKELMIQNALLGPRSADNYKHAVRMWILVFQSNDMQDALDQESLWKGGNKNEFTLCVGVDSNYKVNWAYVISWTRAERLKVDVRDFAQSQETLDLNEIVNFMSERVREDFVRQEAAEWSYLDVTPPLWATILLYVLVLLSSGGVVAFVVLNEIDENNPNGKTRNFGLAYNIRRRVRL